MTIMIFLALLNGCLISICRIINGRLAKHTSAFNASFWNHFIGFIFLSVIVLCFEIDTVNTIFDAPQFTWIGGLLGALFVALNSYILPKLGATRTALFVISGQMVTGVIFDSLINGMNIYQTIGLVLILTGVFISKSDVKSNR